MFLAVAKQGVRRCALLLRNQLFNDKCLRCNCRYSTVRRVCKTHEFYRGVCLSQRCVTYHHSGLIREGLEASLSCTSEAVPAGMTSMCENGASCCVQGSAKDCSNAGVCVSTLDVLRKCVMENKLHNAVSLYEQQVTMWSSQQVVRAYKRGFFLAYFCNGNVCDVPDVLLLLMRVYCALGRMHRVRELFLLGLRELRCSRQNMSLQCTTVHESCAKVGDGDCADLSLRDSTCDDVGMKIDLAGSEVGRCRSDAGAAALMPPLTVNLFNVYLEVLTQRKNFDKDEVTFVLVKLRSFGLLPDALTYHYLIELHCRAGYDPQALWVEMCEERHLVPLPVTLQTLLLRVVPHSADAAWVIAIVKAAIRVGSNLVDKKMLAEIMERWLSGGAVVSVLTVPGVSHASSSTNSVNMEEGNEDEDDEEEVGDDVGLSPLATKNRLNLSTMYEEDDRAASGLLSTTFDTSTEDSLNNGTLSSSSSLLHNDSTRTTNSSSGNAAATTTTTTTTTSALTFPAEYILWLMLEIEVRCVLEKATFTTYVQKQHLIELLLRCARGAHTELVEGVLALMDRHGIIKCVDVLSLVVWTYAQGLQVERALEVVELMARKGFLDQIDAFKKYSVESIRFTAERNFLLALADVLSSSRAILRRGIGYLRARRSANLPVSIHALDVLVLAAAKLGEERCAMQLVAACGDISMWGGLQPRTNTYNSLLAGCAPRRGTALHRSIYNTMLKHGILPNGLTYRILIRHAVAMDCVDDAVSYLRDVSVHSSGRVEVEMLLPILERAARAGDLSTVCQVSQFSLDCDIGIDAAVMHTMMKLLTSAGQNVETLRSHLRLHEALRSRAKSGRQRARSELAL